MIVNELPVPWWWKEKRDPSTEITRLKRSDKPGFLVLVGERQYYLVCVERPPSYLTLVSLIKFHPVGAPTFHVDHFDLLSVEACQYFIDCILKDFDPSVYGLDAETLRSDLDYLRVEAGQWRDFWVQQSRWSASVIEE